MTGTDIATAAQDTTGATLYGKLNAITGAVLRAVNDAQLELRGIEPKATIDDEGEYIDWAEASAVGDDLVTPSKFKPALVAFLIGRIYRADQENENHQALAEKHMQEFVALAKAV